VAKLDASGGHLWSKAFGSAGDQDGTGVAVDGFGNVVVTGSFAGTVNLGNGPLAVASGALKNSFLAKIDGGGNPLWSKRFGDAGYQAETSLSVSGGGDILLGGYFFGAVNFGASPLTSAGGSDVFVAQFSE
jgi:hypothetical protein